MSTNQQPPASSTASPSATASPDQILAANQIFSIATTTTSAQRDAIRAEMIDLQRRMGLPTSLLDGRIGGITARAVFDLTGRRIPGITMAQTSPVLSSPGATATVPAPSPRSAPAPVPSQPDGTAPAPAHGGPAPSSPQPGGPAPAPAPVDQLQTSLVSQFNETASFFDRHKTLLLVTAGLVVATGVAAYLMTSAEGEKRAMDNATLRYAARQLGISPDSDVQSIRAAAARALQAYPDDETRRRAIIEARDVMIRARSPRPASGLGEVSSRRGKMSYQIVTSGLRGR